MKQHPRLQALLIFAVALAVRFLHVWQIRRAPFFSTLMGDARGYDAWAQRIAGADVHLALVEFVDYLVRSKCERMDRDWVAVLKP